MPTTIPTESPDILSWDGNSYTRMDVQYNSGYRSISAYFNVCLYVPVGDDTVYMVFDRDTTNWEFIRKNYESPLLSTIIDQLEDRFRSTGEMESLRVGPLSIYIEFDEGKAGCKALREEVKELIAQQIANLKHATVKRVQHSDVGPI